MEGVSNESRMNDVSVFTCHEGEKAPGCRLAIWDPVFDSYTEYHGHGHIAFVAVIECVCKGGVGMCVCRLILFPLKSLVIFLEDNSQLKITAICVHKPLYPGRLGRE